MKLGARKKAKVPRPGIVAGPATFSGFVVGRDYPSAYAMDA